MEVKNYYIVKHGYVVELFMDTQDNLILKWLDDRTIYECRADWNYYQAFNTILEKTCFKSNEFGKRYNVPKIFSGHIPKWCSSSGYYKTILDMGIGFYYDPEDGINVYFIKSNETIFSWQAYHKLAEAIAILFNNCFEEYSIIKENDE